MDATGAAGPWLIAMIGLAGCEAGPHFVPPRSSATMEPASGRRGAELVAIVRGANTRFLRSPEAVSARFSGDAALVVGQPRVEADDRIRLLLSIPADAPEGPTSLVLEAPPDRFELPFTILPPAAVASARFVPDAVHAGFEGTVDLVGSGTRFSAGVVSAAFEEDSGIRVVSLDVERDDLARVGIAVSAAAPEGVRRAAVGAGGLILSVPMRIVVVSGPWVEFDPPAGSQGDRRVVVVRGHGIEFVPGDASVEFPFNPGVTVPPDGIHVRDDGTTMDVSIEIAADAREGPATSRVRSGGAEARGVFRVLRAAGDAPAVRFSPAAVCAGERAAALHVLGTRTSFRHPGTTARSDYHPGFVVGPVAVLTPTNAIVTISVDRSVPEGTAAITIETPLGGGDSESVTGVVDVLPPCASMTLSPDVFEHPGGAYADQAVDIVVAGAELTEAARLEVERGGGIAVRSFSVLDASRASAVLRISGDAPFGPSTVTLRPAPGVDAVNGVLAVTRAAGDAPTVEPAYLLADAAERGLVVLSGFVSFLDGAIPWPAAVRVDFPGVRVGSFDPPAGGLMTFTAAVSPASPAGHATVGIHGSGAGAAGRGRHVGVRVAVWPAARRAARLSPFQIRAGEEIMAVAVADRPAFVGGGVVDDEWPPDSGIDRTSLPVVLGPSALSLWIRSRHNAPPGYRVVMLHAGLETIPAVLEVLPPEAPPVFVATTGHVPPGATQVVEFVGTGTAWSGETRAEIPAGDLDIERLVILGASGTAATVRVSAAAALRRPGGHVVFLRNGFRTIAAGLVWLGVPAPAPLVLSPAWLHAGAEARVTVSSTAPVLAGATARGVDGVDVVSVEDREAHKATLVLRATGPGRSQGVIEMTVDDAPVMLVIPVLPVPPALAPDRVALPRSPTVRKLDLRPEGLGAPADLIPFPSGSDLTAGRVAETPGGSVLADVLIGVGAVASEPRWLVLAGRSGAAAVRLEIAGPAPAALPAGASESVALEPSVPVVRLLPGASAWTAARAACDDPAAVMTLLGPDGAVALHAGTGAVPWPHVLGPSGTGVGGAFLVVEAPAPAACRLHHGSWWAAPGFDEVEARAGTSGSNDDPGMEERIVPPVPGAAVAFRARLESGFDIDRYAIDLAASASIEVLTGLGRAVPMRAETVLEVVGPAGAPVTADAWDAAAAGIPSVRTTERGTHRISVRPVTGTSGEYVVSIRSPVVINEIDLWSGAGPFVELAAPPGTTLGGYSVERRSATGVPLGRVALAGVAVPADGLVVVASAAGVPGADVVWPGLAGTAAPAAIALIGADGRDADIAAIGGGRGEGTPVAAPPAPATSIGRCFSVDTDDNASDFWRQAGPTPGEPNACDRR